MDRDAVIPAQAPPVFRDPPPLGAPGPTPPANPAFFPDTRAAVDALGHDAALAPLAELIAHVETRGPLSIGLFGGPGSGKSSAAARLLTRVEGLAAAARRAGSSRFVQRVQTVRVSAADMTGDIAPAIAEALRAALTAPRADGGSYAGLAADAAREAVDPHIAARDAMEQLDAARARLDIERKGLEDQEARKARLIDTVLYETAGSGIDAYARSNRASIETRLRAFGFDGDPAAAFKDLARDAADHSGFIGVVSALLRSLWAFKGQTRLLVWAFALVIIAQGCQFAGANSKAWLGALRGLGDQAAMPANWAEAHVAWLDTLAAAANWLAIALIALNLWRALRFLMPVLRGARLLGADIATRRGQIEAAVAHQTRRVEALSRETETLAEQAMEAEKRAASAPGALGLAGALAGSSQGDDAAARARAFVACVSDAATRGDGAAPQRIVVAIDDLDQIAPQRAADVIAAGQRLLARANFVALFAVDPARLAQAWSGPAEAAEQLDRLVQVPVQLPDAGQDSERMSAFARGLLTHVAIEPPSAPDASRSLFDDPVKPIETALVSTLAPIAARSPRGATRYVNIYRLTRGRAPDAAALALMLALDAGATSAELAAVGAALNGAPDQEIAIGPDMRRLSFALAATNKARGKPLTIGEAQTAWAIARDHRMPL